MHRITRSFIVIGVVLFSGFASAGDACPAGAESALVSMNGGLYVTGDARLYQESNTLPGLQTFPGSCIDEMGHLLEWDADTRLV